MCRLRATKTGPLLLTTAVSFAAYNPLWLTFNLPIPPSAPKQESASTSLTFQPAILQLGNGFLQAPFLTLHICKTRLIFVIITPARILSLLSYPMPTVQTL